MLLDVMRRQLDFEVAGILFCDLFKPRKKGLEARQRVDPIDLLVQDLQFFQRVEVSRTHMAILH